MSTLAPVPNLGSQTDDTSWATTYVPPASMGIPAPIAPARPSTTSVWSGVVGAVNNAIDGANAAVGSSGGSSLLNISLEDMVMIVIGMILIAAGVFSFKSAQSVVNSTISIAKKGSEVAAT